MLERVEHTLEPFIFKGARILILGTMPSPNRGMLGSITDIRKIDFGRYWQLFLIKTCLILLKRRKRFY